MALFDLSRRPEHDVCNLPFSEEIRDRIEFFETHSSKRVKVGLDNDSAMVQSSSRHDKASRTVLAFPGKYSTKVITK
jgi:hypothetical protein